MYGVNIFAIQQFQLFTGKLLDKSYATFKIPRLALQATMQLLSFYSKPHKKHAIDIL